MTTKKVSVDVKADTRQAVRSMQSLRDSVSEANDRLDRMSTIAGSMAKAGALVGLAAGATAAAGKIADLGRESIKTQAVFQNLPFSINAARQSTMGLVSDMDLATSANSAMRLGVAKTSEEFAMLSGAAIKLGTSVGQDATESVDSLIGALGRGSTELLDNLGVTLKVEQAHKLYAKQLKKNVKDLTAEEKATAFSTIAKQKLVAAAQDVEMNIGTMSLATQRAAVAMENAKTRALGADVSFGNLQSALVDLGDDVEGIARDWKTYGSAQEKVEEALRKYGTTIEDVGGRQAVFNKLQARANELQKNRLDMSRAEEELARRKKIDQEVRALTEQSSELDHQVNLMRAAGVEQDVVVGQQIESLRLRREALDVETDVTAEINAQKLALDRQIEVAEVRLGAAQASKRRGRGGGRRREGTEFDRLLERVNKDKRFGTSTGTEQDDLMAMFDDMDQARDEQRRAAAEEFDRIVKDEDDRLAMLREKSAERVELARRERAAIEKEAQRQRDFLAQNVAGIATATERGFAQAAFAAAAANDKQGQVFAEEIKMFAGARAKELSIQSLMHLTKGAAFSAALNPVKASGEFIAGGIAAAGAAGMAATYGVAAGLSGGGSGGPTASGPGNAFNLGGPAPGGFDDPEAPVSPLEEGLGASRPQGTSAASGGLTLNVAGSMVDGEKLVRVLQDYERNNGRPLA